MDILSEEPTGPRAVPAEGDALATAVGSPQLATQSMVRRMVDQSTRRARRTALLAVAVALVAVAVVLVLVIGDDGDVPGVVAEVAPSTVRVETVTACEINASRADRTSSRPSPPPTPSPE